MCCPCNNSDAGKLRRIRQVIQDVYDHPTLLMCSELRKIQEILYERP